MYSPGYLLDGASVAVIYSGGYYNGDIVHEIFSCSFSGMNYQILYLGDAGHGDQLADGFGHGLDTNIYNSIYIGNTGHGERASLSISSSLSDEVFGSLYHGHTTRGEFAFPLIHQNLDGELLSVSYTGGLGRGDTVNVANTEILNCTYYSIWTGSESTAWENPANWQCGELPNRYSDVFIPTTVPHFPYITVSPVEIRNLTLDNSSMLHVIGVPLNVLGGPQ